MDLYKPLTEIQNNDVNNIQSIDNTNNTAYSIWNKDLTNGNLDIEPLLNQIDNQLVDKTNKMGDTIDKNLTEMHTGLKRKINDQYSGLLGKLENKYTGLVDKIENKYTKLNDKYIGLIDRVDNLQKITRKKSLDKSKHNNSINLYTVIWFFVLCMVLYTIACYCTKTVNIRQW